MKVEEVLKRMEEMIGERPLPQILMAKIIPECVER
jgi:hypothetical protein